MADHLKLKKLDPSNYFYLLTEITASIFGILVTVVLLTFQLLKTNALRRKDENILHNQALSNFVSISIFIIIGSVYSYSSIHDFTNPNNITIAYFLLYLFILFIILIFPVAILILNEVNWLRKTVKEIQQLTEKDYHDFLPLQFQRFHQKDNQTILFKIGSELNSAIRENDNSAISAILQELNKKTIDLIGNGTDRFQTSQLCQALTFIWTTGNSEALRSKNLYYYATIWESIEELYEFAAENKVSLLHLQDLNIYIFQFIEFLSNNRLSESLVVGTDTLYNAFKINLENNCPPQEQISDLYYFFENKRKISVNMNSDLQWDEIIDLLGHIKRIHYSSIGISDKRLFVSTQRTLNRILARIEQGSFAPLGSYQEAYIVNSLISDLLFNSQKAMNQDLFHDTSDTYGIEGGVIAGFINSEKIFTQRILEDISDFMILNQREKRLTYWSTMNQWGAVPRHTAKHYLTKELVRKSTEFIFSSFKTMKEEIEINQLPDQLKNYLEIKNQIKALKSSLIKDGGEKIKLIKRIDKFLDSFKEIETVSEFKIVKWQ